MHLYLLLTFRLSRQAQIIGFWDRLLAYCSAGLLRLPVLGRIVYGQRKDSDATALSVSWVAAEWVKFSWPTIRVSSEASR